MDNLRYFGTCNIFNKKGRSLAGFIRSEIDWYKQNGYRRAKRGEPASFNTLAISRRGSSWITLLEDSVEGLTVNGMAVQANIRALGNPIGPSLLLNYSSSDIGQCMMLSVSNPDIKIFKIHVHDATGSYKELIGYDEAQCCTPSAEELAPFGSYTDTDIEAIWNGDYVDEKHRIMELARLLGLDPELSVTGFHNFFENDPANALERLSQTHTWAMLSFRKDTKKLKEPTIQFEGVPAVDIERLNIVRKSDRADISMLVCNKGGPAHGPLLLMLSGRRVSESIRRSFRDGTTPIEVFDIRASSHFDSNGTFLGLSEKREYTGDSGQAYNPAIGQYIAFGAYIDYMPGGVLIPDKLQKKLKKEGALHQLTLEGSIELSFSIAVKNGDTAGLNLRLSHAGNMINGGVSVNL